MLHYLIFQEEKRNSQIETIAAAIMGIFITLPLIVFIALLVASQIPFPQFNIASII